ncbi:Lar family restriction alleviation protein [Yersinia sp. 1652 StPb PI]|uniref:Lar family restriction alleviation protein n=1 Tax=Yersinia sp. 1652 StPb PI TaxID=3061649 RepID=UPI00355C333E
MNNIEELKPCPFCGGKAHLLTSNGMSFLVECSVCLTDFLNGPVGIGWYRSEKDAAADWNDRPSERALIAQLEAAQKENGVVRNKYESMSTAYSSVTAELAKAEAALSAANEKLKGDQVPVAWTDAEELRGMANDGCGYLFKIDPANPFTDPRRQIMLFTGTQQKPVVLLDKYVRNEKGQYILDGKCEPRIGFAVGWNAAIKAAGFMVEGG